jgi:hypothetical protein
LAADLAISFSEKARQFSDSAANYFIYREMSAPHSFGAEIAYQVALWETRGFSAKKETRRGIPRRLDEHPNGTEAGHPGSG